MSTASCPACSGGPLHPFYRDRDVPAHSVRLMRTAPQARAAPRARVELACCERCGFVTNTAFAAGLMHYGADYEETQAYSSTFSAFQDDLARTLIERFDLRGRHVVEIGCGKGAFLARLCELGGNTGTGYDPAGAPERLPASARGRVEIVRAYFDARHAPLEADCVVCQMTLEHVADVAGFLTTLRRALHSRPATPVLFQVPDAWRILQRAAFWDVYHEHCSYFTRDSLSSAFQRAGFEVSSCESVYHGQYLALAATPSGVETGDGEAAPDAIRHAVDDFAARVDDAVAYWSSLIRYVSDRGGRTAVWGGGSKAVAFLHHVDPAGRVGCVVDVNPYKQGRYLPGGGQLVAAPAQLAAFDPALVIAMNAAYHDEIGAQLDAMEIAADVLSLN